MGQVYRPSLDQPTDGDQYLLPPCTKNPDLFTEYRARKIAQRICMSCPVLNSCLVTVLLKEVDPGGVYGGLTERDRQSLRPRLSTTG